MSVSTVARDVDSTIDGVTVEPSKDHRPGHGHPAGPGGPTGPTGWGTPAPRTKAGAGLVTLLVVLVVALGLGLGLGGFFGVTAVTRAGDASGSDATRPDTTGPDAEDRPAAGSGERISPPNKPYSVEIPAGMVKVPQRKDSAIPSETDLSLELEGKVQFGGLIKTGTLSGPAADASYDVIGKEAAEGYADEYEGHPDLWGTGAKVASRTTKLDGRDAVEITARFSPSGDPEPSTFFRIYFVDPPSGPTILITCDWNATDTADIEPACESLVASFAVTP
jgi:hypothetical protein